MTKTKEKKQPKVYNFNEKEEEYYAKLGKTLPVWQSPKYKQSVTKAIELIEKGDYGLDEGDFWILMNATKNGKMMYTGLIISHNGCLKINDKLDEKMKFKPSCVEIMKDESDKVKVMRYINDMQGVYEFGEISPLNCKNDYPYAMVLKRLMDRVILKNSKVGFFGIYSDSESEDFKQRQNDDEPINKQNQFKRIAQAVDGDMQETQKNANQQQFAKLKEELENCGSIDEMAGVWQNNQKTVNTLKKYAKDLYSMLIDCKEAMKQVLDPEQDEDINYSQAG